jgi:hypothetical protein
VGHKRQVEEPEERRQHEGVEVEVSLRLEMVHLISVKEKTACM